MNLPPDLDIRLVKERFKKSFENADKWYSLNSDVYDYFLPQRDVYNDEAEGSNKMDKINDSTALQAIQEGASRIVANIAPSWKRWAKVEPSDSIVMQLEEGDFDISIEDIRENLDKQTRIAFDCINRSNFQTQFYEMCLDLMIGTATMKIDEEDSFEMPFSFHAVSPKGISFEEGPNGTIETHWRKFSVKARNVTRTWKGFKPSTELQSIIDDKPDSNVSICEGVAYSEGKYYGLAWREGEDSYSWSEEFDESSPFVTGRWAKASGEVRGRGPAMQTYPDVRSLNKVKEFTLQTAALSIAGMWTAVDDGVTNPYNITVSPGVIIPVGSNSSTNPSISKLDTTTDLNFAQFQIEDLRDSIRRAFFNDLRDPTGPVRSATEVAIEARELAQRIGSAFGRLQTEVLVPILKRVFYILQKKGLVNIAVDGFNTTLKFTSPLAAAQDQEDLMAIQQAVEFTYATAGEELVKVSFALDKFGEYAGRLTGMPQELIRTGPERAKALKAGMQMKQMEMQGGQPTNQGQGG